jgi:hypothetical protein
MNTFFEAAVTIGLAIVTLAIVATLVARRAQTPAVVQSVGSAFSNAIGVAEAPVTGTPVHLDLSYPGHDFSASYGFGTM